MDIEDGRSSQGMKQRYFVLLGEDEEAKFLQKVLERLLELVKTTIELIFSKGLEGYVRYVSDIKKGKNQKENVEDDDPTISELISGLVRSRDLRDVYRTADYHCTMFSFQEYFHSSYRARKGSVLEEVLAEYCGKLGYNVCSNAWAAVAEAFEVSTSGADAWTAITKSIGEKREHEEEKERARKEKRRQAPPDVDLAVEPIENKDHLLIIQLRSRDDTGGSTAKASLTKALEPIVKLAEKRNPHLHIFYLIGIWEPRGMEQRTSLVGEIVRTLEKYDIPKDFDRQISCDKGSKICQSVFVRLAYGVEEIENFIFGLSSGTKPLHSESGQRPVVSLSKIASTLRNWDDFWLTYAVVSLELNQFLTRGKTNISYLKDRIIGENHRVSAENIDALAKELHSTWEETVLPFEKPADNYLYIRDMLYLYMIYQRHRSQTGRQREKSNTRIQSQQQRRSRTGKRRRKPSTDIQSQQQFPTMEDL